MMSVYTVTSVIVLQNATNIQVVTSVTVLARVQVVRWAPEVELAEIAEKHPRADTFGLSSDQFTCSVVLALEITGIFKDSGLSGSGWGDGGWGFGWSLGWCGSLCVSTMFTGPCIWAVTYVTRHKVVVTIWIFFSHRTR